MTTFTPEDLLLYLYKESSPALTQAIEKALAEDWTLKEKLAVLQDAGKRLDAATASPREETLNSILQYARNMETTPADH